MLFGSIWFVVFWGLVIWTIVTAVGRGDKRDSGGESAPDIAKRRYARGEISREQYEQLRHDLTGSGTHCKRDNRYHPEKTGRGRDQRTA